MRMGNISVLSTLLAILPSAAAMAGTVQIDGVADGTTKYQEYFSDGEIVVGDYWYNPNTGLSNQQRFHQIGNPNVIYGGNASYDGFPHDGNVDLGSFAYNESGLTGVGAEQATITSLTLNFTNDPEDPGYVNFNRWTSAIVVNNFNGYVTLQDGVLTGANLTSSLTVTILPNALMLTGASTAVDTPGTFSISGTSFSGGATLSQAYSYVDPGSGEIVTGTAPVVYSLSGQLVTVPEPASLALVAGAGLLALRRRNPITKMQA